MARYRKYERIGDIHWRWYLDDFNVCYKVLVDDSVKHFPEERRTVIDIGCGDGLPTYLLALKELRVTGIDPEKKGLEIAKERLKYFKFTGHQATIEEFVKNNNQTFDYLYSLNTIEHVDDNNAFVEMMKRIKNFGIVVTDRFKNKKHPVHIKEYTVDSLKELFKDFKVEEFKFSNKWTNDYFIGIKIYG